jgi:hypothetical protein
MLHTRVIFLSLKMRSGKVLFALLALVTILGGCGAAIVDRERAEARQAQADALNQTRASVFSPPPNEAEIAALFGPFETYNAADLTLHSYELGYDEIAKINALVADAGSKGEWLPSVEPTFSSGDAAELAIQAPGMVMFLPLTLLTFAHLDEVKELGPRRIIFAYDEAGDYRWTLCCIQLSEGERGGKITQPELPLKELETITATLFQSGPENDPRIVEDELAIYCSLAKAGSSRGARFLYTRIHQGALDPAWANYWARTDSDFFDGKEFVATSGAHIKSEVARAGAKLYAANPLESLDCRNHAQLLMASQRPPS